MMVLFGFRKSSSPLLCTGVHKGDLDANKRFTDSDTSPNKQGFYSDERGEAFEDDYKNANLSVDKGNKVGRDKATKELIGGKEEKKEN